MAEELPIGGQLIIFPTSEHALKRKNRLAQRKHRSSNQSPNSLPRCTRYRLIDGEETHALNESTRTPSEPRPSRAQQVSPRPVSATDYFQTFPQVANTYSTQHFNTPDEGNMGIPSARAGPDRRMSSDQVHPNTQQAGHEGLVYNQHNDFMDLGMFQGGQTDCKSWPGLADPDLMAASPLGDDLQDISDMHLGAVMPTTMMPERNFSLMRESPAETLSTFAPSSSSSISGLEDSSIEARMERVLDLVEELQFENMDNLISLYYTSRFKAGSLAHWAQTSSRTRRLSGFLAELHGSTQDWHHSEAQFYNDAVRRSAEQHYARELRLHCDAGQQQIDRASASSDGEADGARERGLLSANIRQMLSMDEASRRRLKRDKLYLREQIPDTWSLLSGLARDLHVPEPQGSQAVWMFLRMLNVVV